MVNSGSFDSADGNRNGKTRCTQAGDAALGLQLSDSDDAACKSGCSKPADGDLPSDESAIEPTATKTEINSSMPPNAPQRNECPANNSKGSACCSLPLEKTQNATNSSSSPDNSEDKPKQTRKLLCLYCDRSFVSANLRQKHVERIHSVKPTRRVSARRQNQLSTTPCAHCDKLNGSEHTLNDLFQHLNREHPTKYFGCLPCEERFITSIHLSDHNRTKHFIEETTLRTNLLAASQIENVAESLPSEGNVSHKVTRSKLRSKAEEPLGVEDNSSLSKRKKTSKLKELRNKKISVKTSKIAIKRSKRLQQQAKEHELQKRRRDKKLPSNAKQEATSNSKQLDKSKATCVNPYPEFDSFYRVKKITDHSIDNLKISSLTFDDVFDKAFFNRIKCNIEENLSHHIDGKLFKNEESESRISNFEKISTVTQEVQNPNADNYGCEISLNAITPVPSLSLSSQFGEDFESQIEYGSKPSKKKTQIKSDEVHYKYFTRRKYQASILQQKENRDLSKLDMWTQMVVKERQERVLNKKKSAKEIQEYTSGHEYKSKIKRQELNRVLDRRGPFEDLKEEASKKAAFDKLNSSSDNDISEEVFTDVREVLNELLNRVFEAVEEDDRPLEIFYKEVDHREIPAYLDLRRKTSSTQEEIDKSDRIALICSSQETENFELPTNTVRGKNELVELTGEWARSRMYICAACGGKFSNMKYLLEHKSLYHQNVWVQHYEFVGNQSELYRHLSIPGLGKVGIVEDTVPCKQWKRSDARTCTKCGKQCNALGELHRHILECGGDWTWMLARKKCKYRPFGAKSRRKRRGFEPKIHNKRKTEPSEKKIYKKPIDGPRQRPSDADTIQRMLANLPAKRSRRCIISLTDVVFKSRNTSNRTSNQTLPTSKIKCGKAIHKKQQIDPGKPTSNLQRTSRALRSFNKVLSSRILDLNSSLLVKRKIKVIRSQRLTRNAVQSTSSYTEVPLKEISAEQSFTESDSATPQTNKKRRPPKKEVVDLEESNVVAGNSANIKNKSVAKRMLTSRLNLKNFFPVKKNNVRSVQKNSSLDKMSSDPENILQNEESTISNEKSNYLENVQHLKKNKRGGLKGFVRALSLRKRTSKEEEAMSEFKSSSSKIEQVHKLETTKKNCRSKAKQMLPTNKTDLNDIQTVSTNKDVNLEVSSKKRKLQRSFRNVINKVKKIKTEKISNKSVEITHAKNVTKEIQGQPFLETPLQKDGIPVEKIVTLAEIKENIQGKEDHAPIVANLTDSKENPPIPETIFNLANNEEKSLQAKGELDFDFKQSDLIDTADHSNNLPFITENPNFNTTLTPLDLDCKTTPVAIDTSLKSKSVPLISPNLKGKLRKPSRGLNDCIAMLTSKLNQKDEKISSSLESLFSTSSTTSTEQRTESRPLLDSMTTPIKLIKSENLPKIPIFSVTKSPVMEETALDLSKKSFSTPNLLFSNSHDSFMSGNVLENKDKEELNEKLGTPTWTSVDDIIQQVVQNSASHVFNKTKKNVFTTRNNVDGTIDFVVNNSLDWFESRHTNSEEKPKYYKKSKRKKHTDDNLITNIIFGKDKLIIAPSSNPKSDFEDPLIAKIKENEYKMSHLLLNSSNKNEQHNVDKANIPPIMLEIPFVPATEPLLSAFKAQMIVDNTKHPVETELSKNTVIEQDGRYPIVPVKVSEEENQVEVEAASEALLQDIVKRPIENDNFGTVNCIKLAPSEKNEIENIIEFKSQHNLEENNTEIISQNSENENVKENVSRDEIFKTSNTYEGLATESKTVTHNIESKVLPKKAKTRRRGKTRKSKLQSTKKTVIKTNIGDSKSFKEVSNNEPDTRINLLPDIEFLGSLDRKIELSNESEPLVLESKVFVQTAKLPSDSEDEVPLAIIAKLDECCSYSLNVKESDKTMLRIESKKDISKLKECKDIEECNVTIELLEEPVKANACPDSLNDTKDMAENLTTDSLKENVEQTVNKNNTLLNNINKSPEADMKMPNIVKTIKKKRRKKILYKNRRRVLNKKNPSIELDALVESKANSRDSAHSTPQEKCEILYSNSDVLASAERNTFTFKKTDLFTDPRSVATPDASEEVATGTELPNLKTVQSVDAENKTPIKLQNSQRTRRKSKSSKKIDKIDNDLFKNFSLVINKKTKRIPPTSIVDDSVCDDILDTNINFFIKPLEVSKETDIKIADVHIDPPLNDSVEEMDMEIEDIPINSSIIERDDTQIATLTTSYKAEMPFITVDVIPKSSMSSDEKESLITRKSPRKKNSPDLAGTIGKKCKKHISDFPCTDISNNGVIDSKSISTLKDDNDSKSLINFTQQKLLSVNSDIILSAVDNKLDKTSRELTELNNTANIQINEEKSLVYTSEKTSSINDVDPLGPCSDTSSEQLHIENVLSKNSSNRNSLEKDHRTKTEKLEQSKDESQTDLILMAHNDSKGLKNHYNSTEIIFETDKHSQIKSLETVIAKENDIISLSKEPSHKERENGLVIDGQIVKEKDSLSTGLPSDYKYLKGVNSQNIIFSKHHISSALVEMPQLCDKDIDLSEKPEEDSLLYSNKMQNEINTNILENSIRNDSDNKYDDITFSRILNGFEMPLKESTPKKKGPKGSKCNKRTYKTDSKTTILPDSHEKDYQNIAILTTKVPRDYLSRTKDITAVLTCNELSSKSRRSRRSKDAAKKDDFLKNSAKDQFTDESALEVKYFNTTGSSFKDPETFISHPKKSEDESLSAMSNPSIETENPKVKFSDIANIHESNSESLPSHSINAINTERQLEEYSRIEFQKVAHVQDPGKHFSSSDTLLVDKLDNILNMSVISGNNVSKEEDSHISKTVDEHIFEQNVPKTRCLEGSDHITPCKVTDSSGQSIKQGCENTQNVSDENLDILASNTSTSETEEPSTFEKPLTYPCQNKTYRRIRNGSDDVEYDKIENKIANTETISKTFENTDRNKSVVNISENIRDNVNTFHTDDSTNIHFGAIEKLMEDSGFVEKLLEESVGKKSPKKDVFCQKRNSTEVIIEDTDGISQIGKNEICPKSETTTSEQSSTKYDSNTRSSHIPNNTNVCKKSETVIPRFVDSIIINSEDIEEPMKKAVLATHKVSKEKNTSSQKVNKKTPTISRSRSIKQNKNQITNLDVNVRLDENITLNTEKSESNKSTEIDRKSGPRTKIMEKVVFTEVYSETDSNNIALFPVQDVVASVQPSTVPLLTDFDNKLKRNQDQIIPSLNQESVFMHGSNSDLLSRRRSGRNKSGFMSTDPTAQILDNTILTYIDKIDDNSDKREEILQDKLESCVISESSNTTKLNTSEVQSCYIHYKPVSNKKSNVLNSIEIPAAKDSNILENHCDANPFTDETTIKSRRPRKIIDYNEDNLEKKSMEVNKTLKLHDTKFNKDVVPPTKKNKRLKKNFENIEDFLIEKSSIHSETSAINKDKRHKSLNTEPMNQLNNQVSFDVEDAIDASLWDSDVAPMVYKVSEFSEIPKLVIDIHHTDQIDQKLQEHIVETNVEEKVDSEKSTNISFSSEPVQTDKNNIDVQQNENHILVCKYIKSTANLSFTGEEKSCIFNSNEENLNNVIEIKSSSAVDLFNLEESIPLSISNKNSNKNSGKDTNTILEDKDRSKIDISGSAVSKETYLNSNKPSKKNRRYRKQIESKKDIFGNNGIDNASTSSTTESNTYLRDPIEAEIHTQFEDTKDGHHSAAFLRCNRRSRKNINYNEDVLLNTAESISSNSITEKKKRKYDKSLNLEQSVSGDEEMPLKDNNAEILTTNHSTNEKTKGNILEEDKVNSRIDSVESLVKVASNSDTSAGGPQTEKHEIKPKRNENGQNTGGIDLQNTITEPNLNHTELMHKKDIFDFEENTPNEGDERKNDNIFEMQNKEVSGQLARLVISRVDEFPVCEIKNGWTKETYLETSRELESEFSNDHVETVNKNQITTEEINTKDYLPMTSVKYTEKSNLTIHVTKVQKSHSERKIKKPKKNNMDIDIANILDSDNDSKNRRSPRKRKKETSDVSLENTIAEDSPMEASTSLTENKILLNDLILSKETEIKNDGTPETWLLESKSNLEILDSVRLYPDISEDHSSDSDESLPLLERINDFQNKLAVKDNKCNNLTENTSPLDSNTSTKCVLDIVNSPKDSLPIISVSSTDDLFKTTDSCYPVIDDKLIPCNLDTLLPVSRADSMEDVILETKHLPPSTRNKKRKMKKNNQTKTTSGENPQQTETFTESEANNSVIHVPQTSYEEPERQYQLAKINIKDLLLSSLAPPDSTYIDSEQNHTTTNLEDKISINEQSDDNDALNVLKPVMKCVKVTTKKQRGKQCRRLTPTRDGFEIFDDAVQENGISKQKNNKPILSKNLSFSTLKNVLTTFTKTSKKNTFKKSGSIFSEIQPLTEIITSSEMDIAPVLDEIDKSLESEDIYDFTEDVGSGSVNMEKRKSTNKSKNRSKSCPKADVNKLQSTETRLDKESSRRTSNRSAKVKALENIHEKALTESQDLEVNIPGHVQSRKSRRRSKSLNTKEVDIMHSEKEPVIDYGKSTIDKESLLAFEEEVANILNTPSEQYESDLLNELEVINSSISSISKVHPNTDEQVETDTRPTNFTIPNQSFNPNIDSSDVVSPSKKPDHNQIDNDGLELRRSRRGSRKVASYNENDLIDPLIDALENRRNRPSRKDKSTEKHQIKNITLNEEVNNKPKLSSEELFDLLKNSSYENENVTIAKPHNSFFDNINGQSLNGTSRDITDDEFDNIIEKPSQDSAKEHDPDKIYEFTEESPENTEKIKELFGKNKKKSKQLSVSGETKVTSELTPIENNTSSLDNKCPEIEKDYDQEKSNYCDICKKSFIRVENLIKHKTTLTHISKLSELEAKEAEEKAKLERQTTEEQTNSSLKAIDVLKDEINITDILQQSERTQVSIQEDSPPLHNNHSLKLVDIISDVLNKPVLENYNSDKQEFSASNLQNKTQSDIKRYKSLGERKSFESENHVSQINTQLPTSYLPPPLSQTTILEKQINLLENIIGNNLENISANKLETGNNFIDEISSCSNGSDVDNNSCTTNRSVFNVHSENIEANPDAAFIKPTQYEEISEDSASARVYEDPKQRKTLNRDEELFLECCSLLKSGSEVSNSNYPKKMNKPVDSLKELDEPELLDNQKLIQTAEEAHEYSDNSRTPTPLGDTYDDEASNSNTISSNWHLHSEKPLDKNRSFSFEEVKNKEAAGMSFGEILTKGLRNQFENIAKINERSRDSFQEVLPERHIAIDDRKDDSDSSTTSISKKIATKGARKVYEGLKVSIPTEDLNLDVLNTSPLNKKCEVKTNPTSEEHLDQTRAKPRSTRKSKPVKKSQVGSNLLFKVNKKKSSAQVNNSVPEEKQDIYNFEETQDNTDVFIKPSFKDVKSSTLDTKKDALINSDNESLGYADSIGADAKSVSSVSSISAMSAKKPEITCENITKKKYKIMGKIFRNAAKSKMNEIDEELRSIPEIPEIDNLELVENYVRSCQRVKSPFLPPPPPPPLDELPKKPKMTEEEMNMLFDQLLGKEINDAKPEKPVSKASATKIKNGEAKKKHIKMKNRKRARGNSDSSDDEFNINRTAKKRANKKNNQEDSGINLELELKECIGVASRKSQRTCTSGKQNILVEYWSSDEEAFEAMLESHKVLAKKEDEKKKAEKKKSEITDLSKKSVNSEVIDKPLDKPPKPKPTKRKTPTAKKSKPANIKVLEVNSAAVAASNRRKRAAPNPLYHWSSSSEDESQSLIEIKPIREEDDEDDRPVQHGWIVGDSPKKLVTMLALTKGKKTDIDSVKEQGKKRTSNTAS